MQGLGNLSDMLGLLGGGSGQNNFGQPDMAQIAQMLENPAMQSMMSSVLNNPAVLDEFINSNPAVRQMVESNPQLRERLRDPEYLAQLTDPQVYHRRVFV